MKRSNLLLLYIVSFVIGTVIFIDLFHTVLLRSVDVLFYRGIALLLVTCTVIGVILLIIWKRFPGVISLKDIYIMVLTLLSVNLLFFTHLPVTAERSISVFLLGYMNNHADRVLTVGELTSIFKTSFIENNKGIEKRLHEQSVSGNITEKGNGYVISQQGRLLMRIYSVIAKLFHIDTKNISP